MLYCWTSRAGEDVKLVEYEASPAGMITSWKERITDSKVHEALEVLWQKDKPFFWIIDCYDYARWTREDQVFVRYEFIRLLRIVQLNPDNFT